MIKFLQRNCIVKIILITYDSILTYFTTSSVSPDDSTIAAISSSEHGHRRKSGNSRVMRSSMVLTHQWHKIKSKVGLGASYPHN